MYFTYYAWNCLEKGIRICSIVFFFVDKQSIKLLIFVSFDSLPITRVRIEIFNVE